MENLTNLFGKVLHLEEEYFLNEANLDGIADFIKSHKVSNIIVLTGAGLSTAAGIPDFRSPESGLYANLSEYNLPYPEAVFDISYFKQNPEPFFKLAKALWPENLKPTLAHYFIKLIYDKGLLLRNYTQNIDTLEFLAGLPEDKLVEAHGSFRIGKCLKCGKSYNYLWLKKAIAKETPDFKNSSKLSVSCSSDTTQVVNEDLEEIKLLTDKNGAANILSKVDVNCPDPILCNVTEILNIPTNLTEATDKISSNDKLTADAHHLITKEKPASASKISPKRSERIALKSNNQLKGPSGSAPSKQSLIPKCEAPNCDGIVKPNIIFFGEALPERFFRLIRQDFARCDLLIVMGTSLVVQPFASLVNLVPSNTPRLLINKEKPHNASLFSRMFGMSKGMDLDPHHKHSRDVFFKGTCDEGCRRLASLLGWESELENLQKNQPMPEFN